MTVRAHFPAWNQNEWGSLTILSHVTEGATDYILWKSILITPHTNVFTEKQVSPPVLPYSAAVEILAHTHTGGCVFYSLDWIDWLCTANADENRTLRGISSLLSLHLICLSCPVPLVGSVLRLRYLRLKHYFRLNNIKYQYFAFNS